MEIETKLEIKLIVDIESQIGVEIAALFTNFYSPEIINIHVLNLLEEGKNNLLSKGFDFENVRSGQVTVFLSSEIERPSLNLSVTTIKALCAYNLSLDFDPYT